MKPILIVENNTNPLSLNENLSGKDKYVLSGPFTEFDIVNRNERVYTANKFLPALQELNERIKQLGVVYGEFDHPDVFDTSLQRASHIITKASFMKESNRVDGEIRLLTTYWGKEARALVDDGCPIFVSSRAAGITESDGSVSLKKLFTYDIVADPGFASAKMSVKPLNESLGYNLNKSNFRIYEMSDESKINQLFMNNNNDFVTKKQLTDYSKYLINEIASTKKEVKSAVSEGKMDPKQLEKLLEYYEELNKTNTDIVKYLDYLANKVQVVVNENKSLKSTTDRLIKHNDYIVENLEKTINYSEYVAEKVDKNISYSEYVAEQLDKNIAYSEYVAEQVDKNIAYSEYVAEQLDKNIAYAEYIAENVDKNIAYSEYVAEQVDSSIAYSEYLAEHVEGNIAYAEYIAENLDDNIAYSEYIAESLDKSVSYQALIVEKLNNKKNKLNENAEYDPLPTPEEVGFEDESEEENEFGDENEFPSEDETPALVEFDEEEHSLVDSDDECEPCGDDYSEEEEVLGEEEVTTFEGNSDTELSKSIDKLIEEAKKRKAAESSDVHFLKFLNKSQVDSFYGLTNEEQESVKLYISEKSFFTQKDVLRLISEALSTKNESLEERIIRMMPDSIKPIWNQLNESNRKSILSQSRLFPAEVLQTESQIEHFWNTRNLKKNESVTKKLVSHEALIQEDKVSNDEMKAIMERFKNI
jgi:hypothetical protein